MIEKQEKIRRKIVKLVFIVYWMLLFEGALRKWALPQYEQYIFFIRDPLVVLIYWIAFSHGIMPKRNRMKSFSVLVCMILSALTLFQITAFTRINPKILLYGWRNYCLYIPLVFIIGETFKGEDLKKLIKWTLLVSIFLAPLVYKQIQSPVYSDINLSVRGAHGTMVYYSDTGDAGGGVIRATGTFTFFHGQQLFIGSLIAFLFCAWILPKKYRPIRNLWLWISSIATLVIFGVDFTRAPMFLAGFIFVGAGYSGFFIRDYRIKFRTKILPIMVVLVALVGLNYYFSDVYKMKTGRLTLPDTSSRTKGVWTSFQNTMKTPLLGYGIGITGRGSAVLGDGQGSKVRAGEDEWPRIIAEVGPVFGVLYILFRILLVVWLFRGAIRATRASSNPLPLLMICYIGPIILVWYITHIGTIHGYGFLFAGFCAAANKLSGGVWEN